MMRKATKVSTLIMTSMLVFGSHAAFAIDKGEDTDGWCNDAMMNKKDGHHNMFYGVNLTEQQRQQMRDLMRQSRQSLPRLDMANCDLMHKLVTADKFDEAAVRAQADKISKQQIDRQVKMAKVRNQMFNLLTPEQKTVLNQKHRQRIEKMQQMPAAPPSSAQK
jgi:protein CpxP